MNLSFSFRERKTSLKILEGRDGLYLVLDASSNYKIEVRMQRNKESCYKSPMGYIEIIPQVPSAVHVPQRE